MTVVRTDLNLDALTLAAGGHPGPDDGGCIMEWVSYLAGEKWSDAPDCVAPSIRQFCMSWNDALPDTDRTRLLKPYLTKVIGTNTRNPDHELERFWLLADWSVRTSTPAWLRLAGLDDDADALEQLGELSTPADLKAAQPILDLAAAHARARDAAWAAARDAAWDATRAAAWDAARDAAGAAAGAAAWDAAGAAAEAATWDAVGAAARDAAWDAVGAAARDAAWAATWDAAWAAAWDAVGAATWDAAWAAAWAAAGAAAWDAAWAAAGAAAWDATRDAAWDAVGAAARDAARDRLAPTVALLQASACDLLDRLCAVGRQ